jgi:hypothetical protein
MMALEAPQEDPVCISEGHLRSRGPNGPPRSGKSAKNGAPQEDPVRSSEGHLRSRGPMWPERENGPTSVETTGDRSVRALRPAPGAGGDMIDRPTEDVFASVADADSDPASP